jgi:hypothetical protein
MAVAAAGTVSDVAPVATMLRPGSTCR